MHLAITTNPHVKKPDQLGKKLQRELELIDSENNSYVDEEKAKKDLDRMKKMFG